MEDGPPCHEFSARILQQRFDTFVEAVDDAFLPPYKVAHVKFSRPGNRDAHVTVFVSVFGEIMEGMCRMNQRFGWNASANQTGATCSFSFDDDGIEPELG